MTQEAPAPAPAPVAPQVGPALTRFRVLAYVTGVFLLLLTYNVVVKYVLGRHDISLPDAIAIAHGWIFMVYVFCIVDLWYRTRVEVWKVLLVVLAGVVPALTFVAERWMVRLVLASPAARATTAAA